MKSTKEYLQDILEHIARIQQVAAAGKQTFRESFMHQDTIIHNYEVIGEIIKRLPDSLLEHAPEVNWPQIKGFRDFLAHSYDKIEVLVVWGAVEQLPALREAVEAMLQELDGEPDNSE
jgi:uncharacterized protein with HEPN domain